MIDPNQIITFGPSVIPDANGWQPTQGAFNLLPFAGLAAVSVGIFNLTSGHEAAGWAQILIGAAAIIAGFFVK